MGIKTKISYTKVLISTQTWKTHDRPGVLGNHASFSSPSQPEIFPIFLFCSEPINNVGQLCDYEDWFDIVQTSFCTICCLKAELSKNLCCWFPIHLGTAATLVKARFCGERTRAANLTVGVYFWNAAVFHQRSSCPGNTYHMGSFSSLCVIDKATPVNLNPFKSPKLDHRECREVYRTLTSFTSFSYH